MKSFPIQMQGIAPCVLCIRCPDRYILGRLLEYFGHTPAVVAHSKILGGPAVWFRVEAEEDLEKVCGSIIELALPLFCAESAVRPNLFRRCFWPIWAAIFGLYHLSAAVAHLVGGTGGVLSPYAAGFLIVLVSLWNHHTVTENTAARIRAVQEMFLEAVKDKTKE